MSFKKALFTLTAAAAVGLAGCVSLDKQKQRNITEFVPKITLETRIVDIDKDGYLDIVYLTKSKKGDYGLWIMSANNDGSFRNPELIRNYGNIDPRTLNFLTFFYHDISKVIENKVR